ncbi:MAG: M12 family metallo-peptidase, partial [Bradymonadia bacterium]
MRSGRRHLVWLWLLVVIACGDEYVKVEENSPIQVESLEQVISKTPSVSLKEFAFHGEDLVRLDLELNRDLFAPGYRETRFDQAGKPLEHPPEAWANATPCHYHGWTVNTGTDLVVGPVALSTCHREDDTWTGLMLVDTQQFSIRGQMWSLTVMPIEPMELGDDGLAILDEPFRASDSEAVDVPEAAAPAEPGHAENDPLDRVPTSNAGAPLYIELGVANDRSRFNALGNQTEQESAAIVNALALLYENGSDDDANTPDFEPDMEIVLVEQLTFQGAEPWDAPPQLGGGEIDELALLYSFLAWAQPNMKGDNFQLFSNLNFSGNTIGKAFVRSMCVYEYSGAVIQATHSTAADAAVSAHEMGHNLGMVHDGTSTAQWDARACNSSEFIMSATANVNAPQSSFSTCSKAALDAFVASGQLGCLENEPPSEGGVCGDGVLNLGEDCDCGQADCSDLDPCCHGLTCQGVTGNECTDDDGIAGSCYRGQCVTTTEYCDGVNSRISGATFEASNQCNDIVDDCSRIYCLRDGNQCTYFQSEGVPLPARDYTPCDGG